MQPTNDLFGVSGVQLRPVQDIPALYRSGKIMGAFLATPALDVMPSHIRRFAQYQRDQARSDWGRETFDFATAKKFGTDGPEGFLWGAGAWKGKRALLWKAWMIIDPARGTKGAQLTGDCCSWGERCKQDTRRAVQIVTEGQLDEYILRQATCLIYSGRGHTGGGASPAGIANWATKCGILLEDPAFVDAAGKTWDFSSYQNYVNLGVRYGATGMPRSIIDITSKNRVVSQSNVRTTDALFDLLLSGRAASVGFSRNTASTGNPVSRFQGSTAHQTCFVGFDDTDVGRAAVKASLGYEDTAVMLDQSWGPGWNHLTNIPDEWQPISEGMYVHSARDAQLLLNEGECFVANDLEGFVAKHISNKLL
jgi:hypothetical protein